MKNLRNQMDVPQLVSDRAGLECKAVPLTTHCLSMPLCLHCGVA